MATLWIDEEKPKDLLKSALAEAFEEHRNDTVIFVRFLNRKDIYKFFP